jgi:hypothetical protein
MMTQITRWWLNSKNYLKEIVLKYVHWPDLAQNRDQQWALVNTVMNH